MEMVLVIMQILDDDGDGVNDTLDAFPLDPTEDTDTDGDGIGNNADLDDDSDGTPSTEAIASSLDSDDDGVLDRDDTFPYDSTEWRDSDFDGMGDNSDLDDDGDGYSDFDESVRCLAHTDALDYRDVPLDTDGDGICNTIDSDDDGDGFSDDLDIFPMDSTECVITLCIIYMYFLIAFVTILKI